MKKIIISISVFISVLFLSCHKEVKIHVVVDFTVVTLINNNTTPVKISLVNKTTGATSYKWKFEGGDPSVSNNVDPGTITFNTAGSHKISLEASNEYDTQIKEITINTDSAVLVDFTSTVLINNFSPATIHTVNNTTGGTSYSWLFSGGTPSTSNLQQPADVVFTSAGDHVITLTVTNGSNTFTLSKTVTVAPALNTNFEIIPSFEDEDNQAPLTATLQNSTTSGINWQWSTTAGAVISNPTSQSPTVLFANPGTYTVTLTANNNKTTMPLSKTITILPNTNLRTHTNIKLGINSAHNSLGSFYSLRLRKNFTLQDNLDTAGKWIDLIYFGLDSKFNYNRFISPDSAQYYAFNPILQAQPVVYINSQEACGCGINFTSTDFDNMNNDVPLQQLTINATPGGWSSFSNALNNRIILFKTQDGRKGAIKIKQYTDAGSASYIIADIKVQKNF